MSLLSLVLSSLVLSVPAGPSAPIWHAAQPTEPKYHVIVLPDLPGGDVACALGINNSGAVCGYSGNGKELLDGILRDTRAVLWEKGRVRDLIGKAQQSPAAFRINDLGQVLIEPQFIGGRNPSSVPAPMPYVVLWDRGKIIHIWKDWQGFFPNAIDATGRFAGHLLTSWAVSDRGKVTNTPLPFPNERSEASCIGADGLIGGCYQHGFITRGFVKVGGLIVDPAPWAVETFRGVTATDGHGTAAETARDSDWHTYLILWKDGQSRNVADLGRYASVSGINKLEEVVGDAVGRPFLYRSGKVYDINRLLHIDEGEVTCLTGINDHGQICGGAQIGGQFHAVVLDPIRN